MALYYPVHLDLAGKRCLVVGGGPVAERKVAGLLEVGAHVRVVALQATSALSEWHAATAIELILAPYDRAHLDGACLVFAATDNPEVNERIAEDARAGNVWINRADSSETGDFIVPAVIRNGELCLSVATGGNQPMLTARIAQELQARFGPDYGEYVAILGRMRLEIKADYASAHDRRAAMLALLEAEAPLRALVKEGKAAQAVALARQLVAERMTRG